MLLFIVGLFYGSLFNSVLIGWNNYKLHFYVDRSCANEIEIDNLLIEVNLDCF